MNIPAHICMGSNAPDAPARLSQALAGLASLPGVKIAAVSRVFLTEPQERKDQPWFHNQAVRLDCSGSITADSLLDSLLNLEHTLGRRRDKADRFGPRTIDLDLLLFGNECRPGKEGDRLILPHPRMTRRAFVLVPLCEIDPYLMLPDGRSVEELLRQLPCRVDGNRIYQ